MSTRLGRAGSGRATQHGHTSSELLLILIHIDSEFNRLMVQPELLGELAGDSKGSWFAGPGRRISYDAGRDHMPGAWAAQGGHPHPRL